MVATAAVLVTLLFTLPDSTAFAIGQGDSANVYCDRSGRRLIDLYSAHLYESLVTGGGYRLVQEHDARGREDQPDSFRVDPGPGAHYYVRTTRFFPATDSTFAELKEGCASNIVYLPGTVTAVEETAAQDQVVERRIFDIHGRLVRDIRTSGIYFERTLYRSGRVELRKKVYLK